MHQCQSCWYWSNCHRTSILLFMCASQDFCQLLLSTMVCYCTSLSMLCMTSSRANPLGGHTYWRHIHFHCTDPFLMIFLKRMGVSGSRFASLQIYHRLDDDSILCLCLSCLQFISVGDSSSSSCCNLVIFLSFLDMIVPYCTDVNNLIFMLLIYPLQGMCSSRRSTTILD